MLEDRMGGQHRFRPLLRRLALIVVCALIALTILLVPKPWAEKISVAQQVQQRFQRGVPPGTTLDRAESWLAAENIKHFTYPDPHECWDLPQSGFNPDALGTVVAAMVPDPDHKGPIVRGALRVFLLFDKQGRAIRSIVKQELTGP